MYRHCLTKVTHLIIPREAARNYSSKITRKIFSPEYKKSRFGGEWRIKQGKAMDGATYGPLTDMPDYTYLDGRPTPLSKGQLRRREENKEMARNVMQMMEELDFTKQAHKEKQQKEEERQQMEEEKQQKRERKKHFKNLERQKYQKSIEEKRSI